MQITQRLTAKVGPLPVYAWALILAVGGYLAYRLVNRDASTTPSGTAATDAGSATDSDLTPVGGDTGSPPASGQGGAADNLNDTLFSQLSGFQGSIDSLTAAVQSSPAFWPGGEEQSAGSGSLVPNTATPAAGSTATSKKAPVASKPAAKAAAPASVRYYTYAPTAKLPSGVGAANRAPAKGPAGTSLHFKSGKGYYYA